MMILEDADPMCLPPDSASALLAAAPWRRYAVIGDSLSAGTGDAIPGYRAAGWSDRLAGHLRDVHPRLAYLNTAVVGATTADTLGSQLDEALSFGPDLLHLPCGANDLLRRQPDYERIARLLRVLYTRSATSGALLTTFTLSSEYVVPVFPDWRDRIRRLNALVRALAAEFDAVLVDMEDHPVNARDDLLSADRIHFSTAGQAVLAAEMVRALARQLTR
ncbi:SGNH/GDSL hydrolase family protein [Cryptosporangium aurantiacum]|uniref:Lysophospholipase L1 n=1 Tax=Cryptosporangium aurantiacum TaxID=134849 RepID=A0A1M7TWR1_9ACTN|nr:SGNH/GDSL hydrolase family protein [Cryptosporangium aurantiacum]SHN75156.1 Lysophospholipase L1 [Cryptosporangium aurantiacum]